MAAIHNPNEPPPSPPNRVARPASGASRNHPRLTSVNDPSPSSPTPTRPSNDGISPPQTDGITSSSSKSFLGHTWTIAEIGRTLISTGWTAPGSWMTRAAILNLAGVVVLVWWALFWSHSIKKWQVRNSPLTWYGPYEFIAVDFLHNYQASRHWLSGGNPYTENFLDPLGRKLCYPPIVLVTFAWCKLLPVQKAIAVWTITLGTIACLGAVAACRTRRELGLTPVPLVAAMAMIATCSPVAFAMERGNYDLMVVPLVLLAAVGLRRTGWLADGVVGYCIALAICLKVYPGLLLVAPLALRRWRAIGWTAGFGLIFLAFQWYNLPIFLTNLQELSSQVAAHQARAEAIPPASHSLVNAWWPLWHGSKLQFLTRIPPSIAMAMIIGGLLVWVGWHLSRSPAPQPVILPVLLWLVAAATFVPQVSNDYNLIFLPLTMLAVWDRRDPVGVHIGLGLLCLYLQPVAFHISTSVLFGFKLIGLGLAAYCVVARLREQSQPTQPSPTTSPIILSARATEGRHYAY